MSQLISLNPESPVDVLGSAEYADVAELAEELAPLLEGEIDITLWDDENREKEEGRDASSQSTSSSALAVDVAVLDGTAGMGAIDTQFQAVVAPPATGGEESSGSFLGSIHPLVWTAAGVLAIVGLDASDSGGSGGNSGNRSPEFVDDVQEFTINEDEPIAISAQATDRDGDELTYTIPSSGQPDNGTVEEGDNPGEYIYTPDPEFSGEDSFTVRVSDGNIGGSVSRTFTITVENVNDAPEVEPTQNFSGDTDQTLRITVPASDVEGDALTFTFIEASQGTVSPGDSPGEYFYTPEAGFSGEDSFTVTVSDGENDVTQTINLRVGLPNEAPEVEETQAVSVDEDEEVTVFVDAEDIDGDTLTYTATEPANGSVEEGDNPGEFVYTPNEDYNGEDSFEVTVDDGKGGTATQTITVTVSPVEDTYELSADDVEAAEGDTDGNTMVFELKLDRAPFDEDVVINVVSQNGTATAGDDFEAVDTQLTFAAGQDTVELTVNLLGDTISGLDEVFTLLITGELLDEDVTVTGTILNDDLDPNVDPPVMALVTASDSGLLDDDNVTSVEEPEFEILAEPGVDIEIFQDGVSIGSATEDSDGVYSFTAPELDDGQYEFEARLSINGGETLSSQPLAVTIDTQAPAVPTLLLAPESDSGTAGDGLTANNSPTFLIAAEAGASVEVFVDGNSAGFATEVAGSPGDYTFIADSLSDGSYEVSAQATDVAGNTSQLSDELLVSIDTSAPSAPTIDLDPGSDAGASDTDNVTQTTMPSLVLTAEAGATVEVFMGGVSQGLATQSAVGEYTFTTDALSDGSYQFTAVATDAAGNASAISAAETVDIDTAAPAAPVLVLDAGSDTGSSDSDGITQTDTLTFTVSAEAGAVVQIFEDGALLGVASEADGSSGQYSFTTSALAEGDYQFTATATDLAGNTSALSLSEDVTIDTSAPVIAALTADAEADTVTVSFDESLGLFDDADFSFTVNELAAAVTGVNAADDSLTFSLDVDLQAGDAIDVALLAGAIVDIAGNGIAAVDFNDDPTGTVV